MQLSLIKKVGVGGVTVHQVQGAQVLPLVGQYFSRGMMIYVVDDPKLDEVLMQLQILLVQELKAMAKSL